MKKNTLSPHVDLLCKTLCSEVLKTNDYQNLSKLDYNKLSSFLINFNRDFSSSKESLNKSLHNWFSGKNTPSNGKLEEIAKSLGYSDYHDFTLQNKRKIQTNSLKQSVKLSPFQKTLLLSGIALLIVLCFPMITGFTSNEISVLQIDAKDKLVASVIQAIVVILFYCITQFSDFGGRDKIGHASSKYASEVNKSLNQFFNAWKYLWLSFSILYIWFCIMYGFGISNSPYAQSLSDIITIFSSICFAYLFSVMDVQSVLRSPDDNNVNTFYTYLIIFTIALSLSSMMSILDRYYNLGFLDGAGIYLLGYANVIVMLYFFGRLESHYLNVNRFVLLPLYTYAIIQIAYVLFFKSNNGGQSYAAYIIGAALILKGVLFFLIREWIKDGKLENYFFKQHERISEDGRLRM